MKTFTASIEERYVWTCPHCNEFCEDVCEDPADQESVMCEHCGEEAKCEYTER